MVNETVEADLMRERWISQNKVDREQGQEYGVCRPLRKSQRFTSV